MSALSPISAITPAPHDAEGAADTAELAKRGQIEKTAADFEAAFLSIMMQQMFTATEVSAPFGGGQAENQFRSFLTEAFAKETTRSGGIGLADTVAREMLKLQGLEE
ncbi:rod-binding protein [Phenylobacterium sp.]|uniref:rod-binding protein n=1 Tax=Phenylobacterium sp. TaxID=1871053 RepID=UPI0026134FC6|nr:rod-binding protein [Phenylobacterium sp.]